MRRFAVTVLAVLALSACQIALPGEKAAPATVTSPIAGDVIEVQSLDAPPAQAMPPAALPSDAGKVVPEVPENPPLKTPKPAEQAKGQPVQPTDPVPEAEALPAPVVVKSPAQLACEKRKGVWTAAGSGGANFCQKPTKDAGTACRRATDCEGYCLARSNTCAPVTPMFGCQEILNEYGRVLTQCLD